MQVGKLPKKSLWQVVVVVISLSRRRLVLLKKMNLLSLPTYEILLLYQE